MDAEIDLQDLEKDKDIDLWYDSIEEKENTISNWGNDINTLHRECG